MSRYREYVDGLHYISKSVYPWQGLGGQMMSKENVKKIFFFFWHRLPNYELISKNKK